MRYTIRASLQFIDKLTQLLEISSPIGKWWIALISDLVVLELSYWFQARHDSLNSEVRCKKCSNSKWFFIEDISSGYNPLLRKCLKGIPGIKHQRTHFYFLYPFLLNDRMINIHQVLVRTNTHTYTSMQTGNQKQT